MRILTRMVVLLCAALPLGMDALAAQPGNGAAPRGEPVPVDAALQALRKAYLKTTAEEMRVRFRAAGGAERIDDLVIRLQAGPDGVQRMLLELGALRIYAAGGRLTIISAGAPGKYFQREYPGALTPASIAGVLPPVPLPQLALVADKGLFRSPTPYTPDVSWTNALVDAAARPRLATFQGSDTSSRLTLTANADTDRMLSLTAIIHTRDGESTLELSQIRAIDPGDPSSWAISTEGRQAVTSLADLRGPPAHTPGEIGVGQKVPDLAFVRSDRSRWSLDATLAAATAAAPAGTSSPPLALVLFRSPGTPERAATIVRDSKIGREALHLLDGTVTTATAVVIELGEFSQEKWDAARREWMGGAATASPGDELLWASSGAQSIDRFSPGAGALIAVISPDRTLRAVIRLDGRNGASAAIATELRAALTSHP